MIDKQNLTYRRVRRFGSNRILFVGHCIAEEDHLGILEQNKKAEPSLSWGDVMKCRGETGNAVGRNECNFQNKIL